MLNGQSIQNRWQIGGDSTALTFPNYSAAPVHELYVVLQSEGKAIEHRFSGIADERHQVFWLISIVFKLADAGLDGGVVRTLWRFGHFGPNRVQVNVSHAGGQGFFIQQGLRAETCFPEPAGTLIFGE